MNICPEPDETSADRRERWDRLREMAQRHGAIECAQEARHKFRACHPQFSNGAHAICTRCRKTIGGV